MARSRRAGAPRERPRAMGAAGGAGGSGSRGSGCTGRRCPPCSVVSSAKGDSGGGALCESFGAMGAPPVAADPLAFPPLSPTSAAATALSPCCPSPSAPGPRRTSPSRATSFHTRMSRLRRPSNIAPLKTAARGPDQAPGACRWAATRRYSAARRRRPAVPAQRPVPRPLQTGAGP